MRCICIVMRRAQFKYTAVRDGCVSAVCPRHGAARHICDAFAIHFAGGRDGSAVQCRKRGIHSVPLVEAADHGGCAVSGSRQYCTAHLRRSVKAHAFPRNGTFVMRDIPRIRANGGRIRCRKAHVGCLSDNYTSKKGCLSIPQTQNIPVRGIRGRFSSPKARAGRKTAFRIINTAHGT